MPLPARSTVLPVLAGVALLVVLAAIVSTGLSRPLDRALIDVVRSPQLAEPLSPLRPITELGSTWAVTLLAGVTLGVGVLIGPWMHGVIGAGVIGAASIGNSLVKTVVARERPDLLEPLVTESGYSFPSGHAALGMVGWGVLAVLIGRSRLPRAARLGLITVTAAVVLLVGLSRVYLGVHYPTDVIAGWTAGGIVVFLYARLTRGVSREPAEGAVDADRAAPRSDPPGPG